MKNWSFQKFDGVYHRGDTKIGINKSGLIRLSSGFCRLTSILNFKFCLLYYDRNNDAIAFKFVNTKEDGILKLTKDTTGATISGKTFFTANGLDLKIYTGRYNWEKQIIPGIGEVFIIEPNKK